MGKRKTLDKDGNWRPRKLKIVFTDEKLTPSAGLGPLIDAFVSSPSFERLKPCLPHRVSNAGYDAMQFTLPLMAGFWYGYDCLQDMEQLEEKPDMSWLFEGIPSPRAFGDFLRDFEPEHLAALNQYLTRQGFAARKKLAPNAPFVLDMDSTSHVQSGVKIEGLGYNYKGEWGLDSLESFDELGFCYGFNLRPGGTFSSVGASSEIHRIFSCLRFKDTKHFRADSAFCTEDVISMCLRMGAKFTITAHGNTNWESKISEITNWTPWVYSDEEIAYSQAKKKPLPEIDVGTILYQPSWSENLRFTIVVKRTKVSVDSGKANLFEHAAGGLRYYGVMTNWNLFYQSPQSVIEHHAKRGNSENFIREKKIHFDLKHFPCLKMNANHAYGLIAMVSYNFLRLIAKLDNPDKPHYAKKIRHRYLYIPGKLVSHARQMFLRVPNRFREEVDRLTSGWSGSLHSALAMS